MKSMGKKLILLSFFLALISTLSIFAYLQSFKTIKNPVVKINILVAKETIPARTLIDKSMIQEIQVTEDSIFNNYIKDASKILGKYSKNTIIKSEGFREENLINKGSNELSVNIDSKHRAISINASGASGVSNLLKSGDYVDVVVYFPEKKELEVVVRPESAKMILENIQVIAVDKKIDREDTTDPKEKVPATFLVTLSVPTLDIEKLVLAEDTGSLKLVLRPLTKETNVDTKGARWQDILGVTSDPNTATKPTVPASNDVSYTVKPGDTLRDISQTFYGDPEKFNVIKDENNIANENQIETGEVLKIPMK